MVVRPQDTRIKTSPLRSATAISLQQKVEKLID